jgi:post-segregation antitoxin (ccd killing protein)
VLAMTTITINLPDKLAAEANAIGLLTSTAVEQMLRENLRRRAAGQFFATADQMAAAGFPIMTMDEIQAEVNAVRASR